MTIGSFMNNDTFYNYWTFELMGFDMSIYECGYEKCDPLHYWGPDKKKFHSLHYVVSGKGTLYVDDKEYQIAKNDFFYIEADAMIRYVADENDPWEYRWVSFLGSQVKSILSQTQISVQNPVLHYDKDDVLLEYFVRMNNASQLEAPGRRHLMMLGEMYLMLGKLIEEFPSTAQDDIDMGKEYTMRALKLIRYRYTSSCTINELSKSLGLNRTYLYKLFMKYVGMSPTDYIEKLRISHACELFKQENMSISEAGKLVGYNDPFYFSRVFKKVMGKSPREYEKSITSEQI